MFSPVLGAKREVVSVFPVCVCWGQKKGGLCFPLSVFVGARIGLLPVFPCVGAKRGVVTVFPMSVFVVAKRGVVSVFPCVCWV